MAAVTLALVNAATIGLLLCSKTAIDRQVAVNQRNVEGIIRLAVHPLPQPLTTSSLQREGPLLVFQAPGRWASDSHGLLVLIGAFVVCKIVNHVILSSFPENANTSTVHILSHWGDSNGHILCSQHTNCMSSEMRTIQTLLHHLYLAYLLMIAMGV